MKRCGPREFVRIAKDTYMLGGSQTCSTIYLVEVKGKRLIIDAGNGKVPIDFSPEICILTHGHIDHTDGVQPRWPLVLLHANEFSFHGKYIQIPKNAKQNQMSPLKFGSHRLEFFHTPGHTPGSICVLDKATGLLFSGDTKLSAGEKTITKFGAPGAEIKIAESLELIDKIQYKLLCPGHGELEEKR